jgi:hypothetical protein
MGSASAFKRSAARRVPPPSARGAGTLWVTPLYRLKTSSHRVAEVLTALAEGLSVAAAVRVFGHSERTLMTWLARAGEHSATVHNHFCSGLRLAHLQLDEIRTRLRRRVQVLWLWLAVDPITN